MSKVSKIFRRFNPQLLHMIVLPTFFFAFMIVYRPFNTMEFFGGEWFAVHIVISACIVLVGTILMRLLYYYLPLRLNYTLYIFWCLLEVVFNSFFVALYAWLIAQRPAHYFEYYFTSFQYLSTVLIFPYAILALSQRLYELVNMPDTETASQSRMRFYDNKHNLKMVLLPEAFLYIVAEENYVNIFYSENDKLRRYVLRSSMKALDELCQDHGMVRCHRSYYVNPKHVKVLRKDKEGVIFAELESSEMIRIPVSKRYYNRLSEML